MKSRQPAQHTCQGGCIGISENPQGVKTHMVQRCGAARPRFATVYLPQYAELDIIIIDLEAQLKAAGPCRACIPV